MALTRPNLVSKKEEQTVWEKRMGEKREEEEEEEKKNRSQASQGMETNLDYGFYEIWYGSLVLYGYSLASNLGFVRISS